MPLQPYLFFDGKCQEAIDFYTSAVGATLNARMRYKDAPDGACPAGIDPEKIMHACLNISGSDVFLADGMCSGNPSFQGFSMSYMAPDDATAKLTYEALSDGGTATMPLTETFFATSFGMVNDRFGVPWMVVVPKAG
jgi:PhnB protein